MSPLAIQFLLAGLQSLPALVATGANLAQQVQSLMSQMQMFQAENRDPTPAEWAAQSQQLAAAAAALHAKAQAA